MLIGLSLALAIAWRSAKQEADQLRERINSQLPKLKLNIGQMNSGTIDVTVDGGKTFHTVTYACPFVQVRILARHLL